MALLEALVAVMILTVAGLATVGMMRQGVQAVHQAAAAEAQVERASAFLEAIALWPKRDLDQRLGERAEGPWRLRIDRPMPVLYFVALTDSASGRELVRMALYRPEVTYVP